MAAAIAPRLEAPLAQGVDSGLVEQGRRLRDDDILLDVSVASDDRPQYHFAVDTVCPCLRRIERHHAGYENRRMLDLIGAEYGAGARAWSSAPAPAAMPLPAAAPVSSRPRPLTDELFGTTSVRVTIAVRGGIAAAFGTAATV